MNLTKEKKSEILAKLEDRISRAKSFVISEYQGTTVADIEKMRKEFYASKIDFQVAKNTLLAIALKNNKIEVPAEIFDKPITLCWGYEDEVMPAKKIYGFSKEVSTLIPIGVVLDGKFYNADQVKALAALPGKEQLLGQLVGTLNAPISGFVYVLKANLSGLVNVLEQIKSQKEIK